MTKTELTFQNVHFKNADVVSCIEMQSRQILERSKQDALKRILKSLLGEEYENIAIELIGCSGKAGQTARKAHSQYIRYQDADE